MSYEFSKLAKNPKMAIFQKLIFTQISFQSIQINSKWLEMSGIVKKNQNYMALCISLQNLKIWISWRGKNVNMDLKAPIDPKLHKPSPFIY